MASKRGPKPQNAERLTAVRHRRAGERRRNEELDTLYADVEPFSDALRRLTFAHFTAADVVEYTGLDRRTISRYRDGHEPSCWTLDAIIGRLWRLQLDTGDGLLPAWLKPIDDNESEGEP